MYVFIISPLYLQGPAGSLVGGVYLDYHLVKDKKRCTYAQIKSVFLFETYLDVINDFKKRQCFSKLRINAHNIEIELHGLANIEHLDLISIINTEFHWNKSS